MSINNNKKTALGIGENLEAAFAYAFGWVSGIIFLFIEKENQYIRFHALQSIALSICFIAIYIVLLLVVIVGWILIPIFTIFSIVLWIFMIYKAYIGEKYKLYIIGDWVEKQLNKNN